MYSDKDLAIYVHWPYCSRICPYCDFNVYKGRRNESLVKAVCDDLSGWRSWIGPRQVRSIHFGGGTPSLLYADDLNRVINRITSLWSTASKCEIALEANPNDADRWRAYQSTGLNRFSLGIQTFNNEGLKFLGRDHDGKTARSSLAMVMDIFPSVSIDLIFGWCGQTADILRNDLCTAMEYLPHHISTYQLTIEPGTAFGRALERGSLHALDPDMSADFYDHVVAHLTHAGYDHYEVSNFARPDHKSRHNMACWTGMDYVGVGPGAHGRITRDGHRYTTVAELRPGGYITRVGQTGFGIYEKRRLSRTEQASEYLLMGLRISDGISVERFERLGGHLNPDILKELAEGNFIEISGDKLSATTGGRRVLDKIIEKLLID